MMTCLAGCANDDGRCWPSIPEMAWQSGLSVRQVQRVLADLTALGAVSIVRRGGGRKPSQYQVKIDFLVSAAAHFQRLKGAARERGRDHLAARKSAAKELRGQIEQAMLQNDSRRAIWRKQHPLRDHPPRDGASAIAPTAAGAPASIDLSDAGRSDSCDAIMTPEPRHQAAPESSNLIKDSSAALIDPTLANPLPANMPMDEEAMNESRRDGALNTQPAKSASDLLEKRKLYFANDKPLYRRRS